MQSKRADTKRWISENDIDGWPKAEVLALGEAADDYERKLSAMKQYVAGASLNSIKALTGISRQHLYYLIERCQRLGADERPIGFLALVKGKYIVDQRWSSPNKLTAGRALPGALQGLFTRYPSLENSMRALIVDGRMPESKRVNRRLSWAQIQNVFEELCVELGITPPKLPIFEQFKRQCRVTSLGSKASVREEKTT